MNIRILDNTNDQAPVFSDFGQRIDQITREKGINKTWLAEQLHISRQALYFLMRHKKKPNYISELAEILDVNPNWLATGEGSITKKAILDKKRTTFIDVLSWNSFIDNEGAIPPAEGKNLLEIPETYKNPFCIKFESYLPMKSIISNNATVIFEPMTSIKNDEIGLFKLPGKKNYSVRKYLFDAGKHYLIPLNSQFEKITLAKISVIAIAREVRISLT